LVGVDAYPRSPLHNCRHDAEDLAELLVDLGFNVTKQLDAKKRDLEAAFTAFLNGGGAGPGVTGRLPPCPWAAVVRLYAVGSGWSPRGWIGVHLGLGGCAHVGLEPSDMRDAAHRPACLFVTPPPCLHQMCPTAPRL
jgi:hypothetical protein